MHKFVKILSILAILLFAAGCDIFEDTTESKVAKVINFEDNISVIKSYQVKEGTSNFTITLDSNIEYLKKLEGLDSEFFDIRGNKIIFNITPIFNNPKDYNKDNIYEVKLYALEKSKKDYIMLIKLKVEVVQNSSTSEDNSTSNSSDSNTTNNQNESEDSNTTENNSTKENNSSNPQENNNSESNSTNEDNNTQDNPSTPSGGGTGPIVLSNDSDNDYIPDDIETLLGRDKNNPDENNNNILDGLEGDEFFNKQWYIKADGTPMNPSGVPSIVGNDLHLMNVYKDYMGYNKGEPIIVQIVDSGIDVNHEDLKDNLDLSRSLDNDTQGIPNPGGFFKPHGTMLAGIAAARGLNGVGVRGVAPFAKVAGSNWLVKQSLDGLEAAWLSGNGANEIAVSNNSWGRYYTVDTIYEDIMEEGSRVLRDGKGRVYVFASGNARVDNADSNIQYVLNNRFALVVGALNRENRVASYSTPGANVWISAYGGSADFNKGPTIATTFLSGQSTRTWDEDTKKNYTYAMAGSSAAAPMVTGAIALILEACPNLGYRDIKYILAKSAKQVDENSLSWVVNSANFHFSRDYGFGLIDTKSAIKICKNGYKNLDKLYTLTSSKMFTNNTFQKRVEANINIEQSYKIEWIEATIDLDTQNASDYDIYLKSPSGTKTLLVKHGTIVEPQAHIPIKNWMKGGFRFGAGAFLDEDSLGTWSIEIVDNKNNSATLNSVELKIYGH